LSSTSLSFTGAPPCRLLSSAASTPSTTSLTDEDRVALGLQHTTSGGRFGLNLASKAVADTLNRQSDTRTESVNLEAERQLFRWLRLKGGLRLTGEDDRIRQLAAAQADRRAEAQLAVPSIGRFHLSYSEWEKRQALLNAFPSDSLNPLSPVNSAREFGMKYSLGAAEGQAGFGVSVQYARRETRQSADPATWRIGVTYR